MTIKEIHDYILLILNKETGRYLPPEEIDQLLDSSQMQELSLLLGNEREYPQPRIGYGRLEKINQALNPFKKSFLVDGPTATLNDEVLYILTPLRKGNTEVDLVDTNELVYRLDSEIIQPTTDSPIAHLVTDTDGRKVLELFPTASTGIRGYYISRPPKPVFGYTQSGRQVTYDPASSTQMLWDDLTLQRIMQRALGMAGVNLNAVGVTQYNEGKQQSGT